MKRRNAQPWLLWAMELLRVSRQYVEILCTCNNCIQRKLFFKTKFTPIGTAQFS